MTSIVDYRWAPSPRLYRMTRRSLSPVLKAYFRMEWHGIEHIPERGAVVLACNHQSNLDPVLLAVACPRQINYLAKIELFNVPILGNLIRRFGAIPLRRSASDPEAMRLVERVLEHEQLLALFPEGTRNRTNDLKPFRFGAARLALKYNAPLVPAAITGTAVALPAGSPFPRRVAVRIGFGPPLDIAAYRYTETGSVPEANMLASVTTLLQTKVQQLKLELERALP